jgi:hypothetical protein
MSHLVAEVLLRLVKPITATVLGLIVFGAVLAVGEPGSVTLLLISWLVGAALVLLVETSPI